MKERSYQIDNDLIALAVIFGCPGFVLGVVATMAAAWAVVKMAGR